jgi:hypothetical protein
LAEPLRTNLLNVEITFFVFSVGLRLRLPTMFSAIFAIEANSVAQRKTLML